MIRRVLGFVAKTILFLMLAFVVIIVFAGINVEASKQLSYVWLGFVAAACAVFFVRRKKKKKGTNTRKIATGTSSPKQERTHSTSHKSRENIKTALKEDALTKQKAERLARCKYDFVVIDFETTGLNSDFLRGRMDEILSVAIIDQDGNTLLSTLCGTSDRKTWKKSEEIHGITPAMVKGKPTFSEILPQVKEILYSAKEVIAYNIPFEMGFLWAYDAINNFPGGTKIREMVDWGLDPMLMFSAYKGELSSYGDIKWQKLTTAARHFKYSFKEHDALEDVKATLFVYNALQKYVAAYDDKEYILKYGRSYKRPGH